MNEKFKESLDAMMKTYCEEYKINLNDAKETFDGRNIIIDRSNSLAAIIKSDQHTESDHDKTVNFLNTIAEKSLDAAVNWILFLISKKLPKHTFFMKNIFYKGAEKESLFEAFKIAITRLRVFSDWETILELTTIIPDSLKPVAIDMIQEEISTLIDLYTFIKSKEKGTNKIFLKRSKNVENYSEIGFYLNKYPNMADLLGIENHVYQIMMESISSVYRFIEAKQPLAKAPLPCDDIDKEIQEFLSSRLFREVC